jgi:hypothetical protein
VFLTERRDAVPDWVEGAEAKGVLNTSEGGSTAERTDENGDVRGGVGGVGGSRGAIEASRLCAALARRISAWRCFSSLRFVLIDLAEVIPA